MLSPQRSVPQRGCRRLGTGSVVFALLRTPKPYGQATPTGRRATESQFFIKTVLIKFCIVVNQLNQELKQHLVIVKEKDFL
jgi:hypothetical protein